MTGGILDPEIQSKQAYLIANNERAVRTEKERTT